MSKTNIVDYILEEDYARYTELLAIAEAAKAAAPKAPRAPLTAEAKVKAAETRYLNSKAKLDAMMAAKSAAVTPTQA